MTGETIDGITVKIAGLSSIASKYIYCEIYSTSKGVWSTIQENTFGTSEEVRTYGGAANQWGTTWVPSDFTDGNFYLRISSGLEVTNLSVDCVEIRVYSS